MISNPFVVYNQPQERKRNTLAEALAVLKLGLDAYSVYQRGDIEDKRIAAESAAAQRRDEMAQEQLGMQREAHNTNQTLANINIQQKQQEIDDYNKPVDMTTHPLFLSLPPEVKDQTLQFMYENQLVDEQGVGKRGDILKGVKMVESDQKLFQAFMGPVVKAKQGEVMTAWEDLQKANESGDPKKIQEKTAIFERKNGEYQESMGKFNEHIKTLTTQQHQKDMELMKERAAWDKIKFQEAEQNKRSAASNATTLKAANIRAESKGSEESETSKRQTAKTVADAETAISTNRRNQAAQGQADLFNQYANKPYAYTWKPGKVYGGTWEKVTLPKINGRQATAAEVWYTAEQNGLTYDEVLRKIGAIK